MRRRSVVTFFVLAALGAALDMVSKGLAFKHIQWGSPDVKVIEGFFSFGRTINQGIVFGIGQNLGQLFLIISILAVPIIAYIYLRMKDPTWTVTASLGLILGGTIGNLTDRLVSAMGYKQILGIGTTYANEPGGVRDFLRFDFGDYTFPLFNIADSCICVGVAILSVEMLFFDDSPKKKKTSGTRSQKSL